MERELGNEETKDSSSRVNEILLGRDTPEVALIGGEKWSLGGTLEFRKRQGNTLDGGEFLQRGEDGSWVNED